MNTNHTTIQRIAAICAILLGFLGALRATPVNGEIKKIDGDAYLINPAGAKLKLTVGTVVPPGSSIVTDANSTVSLHLLPGANTVVAPGSDIAILSLDYKKSASNETLDRNVNLKLKKGSVFSSLFKAPGTSSFTVHTTYGVAAARGTDWSVSVTGTGISVQVVGGNVVLTLADGTVVSVPAGKAYNTGTGVTDLSDEQIKKLKQEIIDAGFSLSHTNDEGGATFDDQGGGSGVTINPSNLSGSNSVQSPNQ